jgi:hypothetical protein
MNHPHVVKLFDFIEDVDNNRFFIVMEYLDGGTINQITDLGIKRKVFGQVITGVEFLHLHYLAHRDIKPDNLMLDSFGRVRLCDFGISVYVSSGQTIPAEYKGTPAFMAPELFQAQEYNPFKADIWAMGVTLFVIIFGRQPFVGENLIALQRAITTTEPAFPPDADPLLVDLLQKLLDKNPETRMSLSDLWGHPWMDGVKPSWVQLMWRVREICSITSRVQKGEAVVAVRQGAKTIVGKTVHTAQSALPMRGFQKGGVSEAKPVGLFELAPPAHLLAGASSVPAFIEKGWQEAFLEEPTPPPAESPSPSPASPLGEEPMEEADDSARSEPVRLPGLRGAPRPPAVDVKLKATLWMPRLAS